MELELTGHYSALEDSSDNEAPGNEAVESTLEDQGLIPSDTSAERRIFRSRGRQNRNRQKSVINDVFIELSKNKPHYVKEDIPEDLLARARLRILRGVESIPVRIIALLILVLDIVLVIVELSVGEDRLPVKVEEAFEVLTLLFSAYFCGEVALRIVGQGKLFFRRWFEVVDLVVILVTTLTTILYVILDRHDEEDNETGDIIISTSRLFVFGRVIRVFFWGRVVYEHKVVVKYLREKVSQNKRRYKSEGYDLDLTYVTNRVIAMSFPSSGSESLYRNSIQEVGQFLDAKHFGHYRVYNLCSEREYDTSYFHHQVQRVCIDDHNVPKFTDLVDFCEDILTWMEAHEENIIVVHCKGGKGRTGMMISAWLVRSGLFGQAEESLAYFRDRRTDKSRGKKTQGVDTPSQSRYVSYYEKLLMQMAGNLPPPVSLRVKKMTIFGLTKVGKGDGTDWSFEVFLMQNKILECSFLKPEHVTQVSVDPSQDAVQVLFSERDPLVVTDDTKIVFHCLTRAIPAANKCQFFFWFHTTFIEDNRLYLERDELDNLQKSKIKRSYPIHFAVELQFESHHNNVFCTSDAHDQLD